MSRAPDVRDDPLAPLEFVVTWLSALVLASVLVFIPVTVLGDGSFLGMGDPDACTTTSDNVVGEQGGDDGDHLDLPIVHGLHTDASATLRRVEICDNSPTFGVKVAAVAESSIDLLFLLGFLALARLAIVAARRDGVFSRTAVGRTRMLGWFLALGGLTAAVLRALLSGVVVSSAVDDVGWAGGLRGFDMPWTLVVVGLGVITVGRVLRQAVDLQDDVDATI